MKCIALFLVVVLACCFTESSAKKSCPPSICPFIYQPVCAKLRNGSNQQFSNQCAYNAAKKCDPRRYKSVKPGMCKKSPPSSLNSLLQKIIAFIKKILKSIKG